MTTWEILVKCVENECLDGDLRLIAELLIQLKFYESHMSLENIFETAHTLAQNQSTVDFKRNFNKGK